MSTRGTTATGRIALHPRGFGFLDLDDGRSAFVAPPDLNPLLAGDRVRAVVSPSGPGRLAARDLELLERPRRALFGCVVRRGRAAYLKVDRLVANTDWPLEREGGRLRSGEHVVARIDGDRAVWERSVPAAEASLERVLVRRGLPDRFDPELERAAADARPRRGARRDLRRLTCVTIDAPETRDLDDALSVLPAEPDGAIRVFVSIADVDALVPEGSPLDLEARARGTSAYLVGRVVPMLPPALSEERASLLAGEERPALTVEMRIDDEGHVTSVDLHESRIRVTARLGYAQVARYLDDAEPGDMSEPVRETLRWLRTAAGRLSAQRSARGGVTLLREEASVRLEPTSGEAERIEAAVETSAHRLVERLMVAANEGVARWLVERGLPGLFRVHPEPDPERVHELADFARDAGFESGFAERLTPRGLAAFEAQLAGAAARPAILNVLGTLLGPARYTAEPGAHFGLGAPLYLHFTSPIRRYADLAVHRVVRSFLRGERAPERLARDLEALAEHLNARAANARKAELERLSMVAARWLAPRVGQRFAGTVVGIRPFGALVQLAGLGISGNIPLGTPAAEDGAAAGAELHVGRHVEVTLTGVDEELGRIELGR